MKHNQQKGAIVVTGAGSGIGFALTQRLLQEEYSVIALDVTAGRLEHVTHPFLSFHRADVREKEIMSHIIHKEVERIGRIDGLANCAAVYPVVPFLQMDESTWDLTMDINLKGTLFACQAVLPLMRKMKYGNIVLFSSSLARSGLAKSGHYAASKGGVLGLARSLALEAAQDNIRVNVVSPGITDSPQPRGNMSEADMLAIGNGIPLKRIGKPEDVVEAALFLLQDESSFVTGQDLRVDGGALMF